MHETSDSGAPEVIDEHHPLWATERNELRSVGIDIGTTTTHLLFSRLEFRRAGRDLSSRLLLTHRQVTHRSDIILTPYARGRCLDIQKIDAFVTRSYREAGLAPDSIDTGAVIITGEATRKRNARAISRLFSCEAGKFVCACAGHHLEAAFAAHGSGAVAFSRDSGQTVLNIDVGGGTTKFAVVKNGAVIETCAVNIGARLVAFDDAGQITMAERAGWVLGSDCGAEVRLGRRLDLSEKEAMAELMAGCLVEVAPMKSGRELSPLTRGLLLTPPLSYTGNIDAIMFSGGVSGYVYDSEDREFGDLGKPLGKAVRREMAKAGLAGLVRIPEETIRATVIGASQFAVQLSGNTIYISDADVLPLRDLRVVPFGHPQDRRGEPGGAAAGQGGGSPYLACSEDARKDEVWERGAATGVPPPGETCAGPVALFISWSGDPSRARLLELARALSSWSRQALTRRMPLVVVLDRDVARTLGKMVKQELDVPNKVVIVDGIALREFDYIDIGKKLPGTGAVPVVIKSLVFAR